MKKLMAVILIALVPQVASARVYMCVDHETGKTSFTDKACATPSKREEVRVDATNLNSGERSGTPASERSWNSQRDRRKTGADFNAQRREGYAARGAVTSR